MRMCDDAVATPNSRNQSGLKPGHSGCFVKLCAPDVTAAGSPSKLAAPSMELGARTSVELMLLPTMTRRSERGSNIHPLEAEGKHYRRRSWQTGPWPARFVTCATLVSPVCGFGGDSYWSPAGELGR